MGIFCSKTAAVDRSPSEITLQNGFGGHYPILSEPNANGKDMYKTMPEEIRKKSFSEDPYVLPGMSGYEIIESAAAEKMGRASSQKFKPTMEKPTTSGKSGSTKVTEMSSFFGKAGSIGLGKAVNVLDIVGSSMTSFNSGSGFGSGVATKGNKISILAFEVANTIVKGSNLMKSLSKKNINYLIEVVLTSEGVQHLVSESVDELLRIAAADKRKELMVFSGEIVRFGNHCKDSQWHNLERHFSKLESDFTPQQQLREMASEGMECLMMLVHHTAELYHELHALDKYEQDYKRKLQEENLVPAQRGNNLQILKQELKNQLKHVKSLKKKSLWSRNLEEVVAKLVDIFHFLHLEIHDAFGTADGDKEVVGSLSSHQRLGSAGLALHYANIITQIDTLVSRPSSVPPSTRDALYQGLPPSIKSALRSKLQSFEFKEEIKAEMEKTLRWLFPMANNTIRAHHGFGWVGEWANAGMEMNQKLTGVVELTKIETLYHADKRKTEAHILDLIVWLHHLITHSRAGNAGIRSPSKSPIRSPRKKRSLVSSSVNKTNSPSSKLTLEEQEMLQRATSKRQNWGRSKSQEFETGTARLKKDDRLSKSSSKCRGRESMADSSCFRRLPAVDFDIDRIKVLDLIDRVDNLTNL
ncbi:protein PSK SIMULATOR 1-like isoform X2 [Curcuma longa]|uniref:protein PSK SIMULATOR 1-like isoform X2 n=1 Tax=Curcuma longa TaxID=136217 RepID=UPI003D9E5832